MAFKPLVSAGLFLSLNLLFFTMVSSTAVPCPPPPYKPTLTPSSGSCPMDTLKLGICADVLQGIKLNVPVDLSLLLNYCGKKVPADYKCA
ncbi:14 kDa proline-rich protein DC2.15-like [Typha latifolia]|uniref:14 kDa proline-rich protein DC2.15-like n=1 Tax=Typha latifolia TaxID=4733 RepID=UPI003C2BA95E